MPDVTSVIKANKMKWIRRLFEINKNFDKGIVFLVIRMISDDRYRGLKHFCLINVIYSSLRNIWYVQNIDLKSLGPSLYNI